MSHCIEAGGQDGWVWSCRMPCVVGQLCMNHYIQRTLAKPKVKAKRRVTCPRCLGEGHYAKTCKVKTYL